jgi:outer membrane protein OmpA-like peptidoglycan-associated protein
MELKEMLEIFPKITGRRLSLWLLAFFGILMNFLTGVVFANVVGNDAQNFNPTTSGLDFITVQSSETLEPGVINFGLFFNYAVNTLPYFDDTKSSATKISDSLLGADLNMGLGLLPNWDVGVSAPHIIYQSVNEKGYRGQFKQTGNTELRINTKWRLRGDREGGIALIGTLSLTRIVDDPFAGKGAGVNPIVEVAFDKTFGKVALGLNLGYKWRSEGQKLSEETPIEPYQNQYLFSTAASYLLTSLDTKLIAEIYASKPVESEVENTKRSPTSAELLLGAKHDFSTNLAGHAGMGSELGAGRSSPDWRIYTGINYTLGPKPKKTVIPAKVTPPSKPLAAPKAKEKIVIHDVLFEYDSADLVVGQGNETLSKLASYLNQKPVFQKLIIDGHTDSIGSDRYNQNLSQRRASTIKNWLVSRYGISPNKISIRGMGESRPIADNGNFQGRQLNRRVEFTIFRPAH